MDRGHNKYIYFYRLADIFPVFLCIISHSHHTFVNKHGCPLILCSHIVVCRAGQDIRLCDHCKSISIEGRTIYLNFPQNYLFYGRRDHRPAKAKSELYTFESKS